MWLVLGAVWKIILPAVFCLAKGDSKNSMVTTAQESTTNFPRISVPITVFGSTTTTDRYSITVSEPGGTIAQGDPTTKKAVSSVSSIAFEEVTRNFLLNLTNTTSLENSYAIYMTTSDAGGATTPNGNATTDAEKAIGEFSVSQDNILPAENLGSTTPLSTENTIKTITQGQDNTVDIVISFGNVPEDLPNNTQGNSACQRACEIIPPWGTILLCLGTAFFIFALVGLLFLLPYCTKFRRTTAGSCSTSPRCSI